VRKCPYCDFNSHQVREGIPAGEYIAALLGDLEQDLPLVWGRSVSSVYFGGGTPSLFSAADMDRLICGIRTRLRLAPDAEITIEANPGTVERDSFTAYREAGINRVSLGVQSFNDELLKSIGRIHGRAEVDDAIGALWQSGIADFNIDLMFGLPEQTPEQSAADIGCAIACRPSHISHYQLTLEPNTAFAANPPELPDAEACWSMQDAGHELLEGAGYRQYEVSAWSVSSGQCRHNLNYWRYGDFLGIGAGAHAKLTDPVAGKIRRMSKQRHPRIYLGGERIAEDRLIGDEERVFEFFLNHLRLSEGIQPEMFSARTGLPWEYVRARVDELVDGGLLALRDGRYCPTELGRRFVNDMQTMFLP
jgi:oxygen-independent coproporphyrinogen-3 oxidase